MALTKDQIKAQQAAFPAGKYRVKEGKKHHTSMKDPNTGDTTLVTHEGGAVVELTSQQAHAFRDKFEKVSETATSPAAPKTTAVKPEETK